MNIDPEIPAQVRNAYREKAAGFPRPQKVKVKLMEQVTDFCTKLAERLHYIEATDGGWDPETGKVPVRITSDFEDVWVDDSTIPCVHQAMWCRRACRWPSTTVFMYLTGRVIRPNIWYVSGTLVWANRIRYCVSP